ncbi:hypothetical protein LBMAG45_09620 [Nitrospirota bacterium]|nr:hypothetical protein LBMAG45_09620 [Nitrospirota bacterium]
MGVNPTLNAGQTLQEREAKSYCLFVEGVRRSWTRRKEGVETCSEAWPYTSGSLSVAPPGRE